MNIDVNGEKFKVSVSYDTSEISNAPKVQKDVIPVPSSNGNYKNVIAPVEGKFFLTKDNSETAVKVGDAVKKGDVIGYIEAMKVYNAIASEIEGKVVEIVARDGNEVDEDDVLIKIQ